MTFEKMSRPVKSIIRGVLPLLYHYLKAAPKQDVHPKYADIINRMNRAIKYEMRLRSDDDSMSIFYTAGMVLEKVILPDSYYRAILSFVLGIENAGEREELAKRWGLEKWE